MDPSDLPDYAKAFDLVKADADGNLWVREASDVGPGEGGVYDLINRRGELFDRIRVPGGVSIVGFGPGVIYLSSSLGRTVSLVRARIR